MPDKDRIVGSVKQVKGAADKTEGKVQNAVRGLKDTIKEATKCK